MRKSKWMTDEALRRVEEYHSQGKTSAETSRLIGVSNITMAKYYRHRGWEVKVTKRACSKEEIDNIISRYLNNVPVLRISKEVNVPLEVTRRIIREYNEEKSGVRKGDLPIGANIVFGGKVWRSGTSPRSKLDCDETFLEWSKREARNFNSMKFLAKKLGVGPRSLETLYKSKGVELDFPAIFAHREKLYQNKEWLYKSLSYLSPEDMEKNFDFPAREVEKWKRFFDRYGNMKDAPLFDGVVKEPAEIKNPTDIKSRKIEKGSFLYDVLVAESLGDGHINIRGNFICCHCEKQKDYLFWKYNLLSKWCKSPPSYVEGGKVIFDGKEYNKQPEYRFMTIQIPNIVEIREMLKSEKIKSLSPLGAILWILDDAHRESCNWVLCVASLTKEEKELAMKRYNELFGFEPIIYESDERYMTFPAEDSAKIDWIIPKFVSRNLDIIQHKIPEKRR